jgi:hypothetical protein
VVALLDHYVSTIDEKGPFDEEWARSLFTEDVRLEHEIATLQGLVEVAGAHQVVLGQWERTFHFSTNHRVAFEGAGAHLTARLMAIHVYPGESPPEPLMAANLVDADAVQTDEGWRFGRFALRTLWRSEPSPTRAAKEG